MTRRRRLTRFRMSRLSLAVVLAMPVALSACAGALSHIETQRRLDETYAGFPPVFGDPQLNAYRARYLAEWPAYDADPQGFFGANAPSRSCDLPETDLRGLVESGHRPEVLERSPAAQKVDGEHGHIEVDPVYDRVVFRLIDGDCGGGALNGEATIHLSYLRAVFVKTLDWYEVAEVQSREVCDFVDSVRHGACARYDLTKYWTGKLTEDGRLVSLQQWSYELNPEHLEAPEGFNENEVTTFDYGHFADGLETGPGVAFETDPVVGDGVDAMVNHTLTRTGPIGGLMQYVQYYGDDAFLRYTWRDGVPHGEMRYVTHSGPGFEPLCFDRGRRVLTATCPVM